MFDNITQFSDMAFWQKMYFIGVWIGISMFILEIQKITKEIVSKIPTIRKTFREEMQKQKIERERFYAKIR